jgi:glycosyltransferase involved in cell wall biosynthesis
MIWVDSIIGKAAGRLAGRTGAGVLAYSYYASYAFEKAPAGCIRVIFQVHPHPLLTREILQEEMRLQPFSCSSLMAEPDLSFPPRIVGRLAREAGEADFAITPSTFAKQSLVAAGISADKITVVPYGIDSGVFRPKSFQSRTVAQPLRLIFVGSLVQRKGLSYLFEAMRRLKGEPVELVLVGRGSRDDRLLAQFADVSFRLAWNLSRHDLVRELHAADVFVFPSLVESFAHVILEAMSVGLPVITTANTAGPDLLVEGRTGFVGPIRDVGFLVGRIRWFIENRAAVATMGQACQAEAARRSWHRFRAEIRQALIRFEGQWTR